MFRCDPPLPALASDDARAVARAAFDLASARALGNEAALLRALRTWSTRGGNEAALVRLHLLDALVQGEAVVPAAAVLPHRSGPAAVAAFVLLARDAHLNELELLQSFRARVGHAADDLRWVAEGNLLCAMRTPGFAATLLRDIVWELTVVVESSARTG
ncbi:MAG: hypothetical protein JNK15_20650, partial [Planctomycetes bacterium]|nr:hypothetical protein [Planctomycetota bacterium]